MVLGVKDLPANAEDVRDPGAIPGSGRSPGEGNGSPPVFLPRKSHGQRSLVGFSPWDHKESDMTEQLNNNLILYRSDKERIQAIGRRNLKTNSKSGKKVVVGEGY